MFLRTFVTGSFSDDDLNTKRNFYIGLRSPILARLMTSLVSGDQQHANASLWNPTNKTAVGEQPPYPPPATPST